ncbi:MAG: hypothetical protein J6M18_00525 [Actinomycetaceae bacterium]|nr:hypothetical protein [Actinomycetaceae bacterium]
MKKDGSYSVVEISYIQYDEPLWNENGLFLADLKREYWLDEKHKPIIHEIEKEGLIRDSVIFHDDHFYSFYNWGYSEDADGYFFEMIKGDKEKSVRTIIPFFIGGSPAVCDNRVFMHVYGDKKEEDARDPHNRYGMYELLGDNSLHKIVDVSHPVINGVQYLSNSIGSAHICDSEESIMNISGVENLDGSELYFGLERWNVKNESYHLTLLRDASQNLVDGTVYTEVLPIFLENGAMYAYSELGSLLKIDTDNGIVENLNEPLEPLARLGEYRHDVISTFQGDYAYQLVRDKEYKEEPYVRVLDIRTGKEIEKVMYSGLNVIFHEISPSSMAVNPKYFNPKY